MDIAMEYRQLGGTGLEVSRMGIGLAALGRPAYINLGHADDLDGEYDVEVMRIRTGEVLDEAVGLGITYLDAARSYGRAEEFLASWLATHPWSPSSRRLVVGSKWGYTYTGGWQLDAEEHEVKEHSHAMFAAQLRQSRDLLGDALDLYQVHSLTLDSGALDDSALLDALAELRNAGTPVGASLSGPAQSDTLERMLEVERDGEPLFATVQATYNVLEPSVGSMLAAAHDAGRGVLVKEAVANGRLTARSNDRDVLDVLTPIADRQDVTVDAVALAAVLARPWVDVVLSGVATTQHLRQNVRALDVTLTDDDVDAVDGLAEPADQYWARRGDLAWK